MIPSQSLHDRFLNLLPRIECHARIYFRDVRCPDSKADRVAEVVALAWKWFLRLEQRGKDVTQFAAAFATWAARAVRCGRRVGGMEAPQDILSPRAQQRFGLSVTPLPEFSTTHSNVLDDVLRDNAQTPPPDAAAFRIDFPRWLATLNDRDQGLAQDLMIGEKTMVAADKSGVSPARVSQLRRELHHDWNSFHGEANHDAV